MTNLREKVHQEAQEAFFNGDKKGILHIAMRVGKTKIGLNILKAASVKKILILYPDNKIANSWRGEIQKWGAPVNSTIHMYNYASIDTVSDIYWDAVVFDEIHATSDNQRTYMQTLIDKTNVVLGLSGTLSSSTMQEMEEMSMHVLYKYTIQQAIDDGIIAPYNIMIHTVNLDEKVLTKNKKGKLKSEKQMYDSYTFVINKLMEEGKNVKFLLLHRNRVLQGSIAKRNKTLQLLEELKYDKVLVFTGLKRIAESLGIPFHHSTSDSDDIFDSFVRGETDKMAVVNIGRAGLTFNYLDNLIINSFTGNEETTEQIISRVLNKEHDSKIGNIHIIVSSEEAEQKKLRKTLSGLNSEWITYV